MSLFRALDISASGLHAGRVRMDTIAQNIANAESVTDGGTPYRRQEVVLMSEGWRNALPFGPAGVRNEGGGVRVLGIRADPSPPQRVYRPEDPAADAQGYVTLSNVNLPLEMVDLVSAARAYEANAAALRVGRETVRRTLDILR
jgi:flagellar basal-body rod protein FlgC